MVTTSERVLLNTSRAQKSGLSAGVPAEVASARRAAGNGFVGAEGAGDQPLIHGVAGFVKCGIVEGFADKVCIRSTTEAIALKALELGWARHFPG